ncbi:MAG: Clp protease N-terminal domain-containing protein [Thermomicrobiales bacterium]
MDGLDETPDEELVAQAQARLGPRAAAALQAARQEAAALGRGYVCTEHLLVGLARERDSVAARALAALQLSAETLHQRVYFIAGRGNGAVVEPSALPLSPRMRHVLVSAEHEAARRGLTEIGTIHLLVGLVRERVGLAVLLLHVPGIGLERIGVEILRCVREGARD